jgi:hypothetical protein
VFLTIVVDPNQKESEGFGRIRIRKIFLDSDPDTAIKNDSEKSLVQRLKEKKMYRYVFSIPEAKLFFFFTGSEIYMNPMRATLKKIVLSKY